MIDNGVGHDFPSLKYAAVERERRWLCRAPPPGVPVRDDRIEDLYLRDARLRLRRVTASTGEVVRKLTKKADLAPDRRLLTNIYLSESEYVLLAALPGDRLRKRRLRYAEHPGVSVDIFDGALQALVLAEMEFENDAATAAHTGPPFAVREVTADVRFGGAALARERLPRDFLSEP